MLLSYREALNQAMREEMRRDSRIFLIGEEVGYYQGAFKVTKGFVEEFGPQRVVDTPITEAGFTGLAIGAARPQWLMRVPSSVRNWPIHAGCAGHAGADTRLPSVWALSTAMSAYRPPASSTSARQAG